MQTQNAAAAEVLFEDPALLGFDLSEDDDEEGEIGSLVDDAGEDDLMGVLDGIVSMLDDAEGLSPLQKAKLSAELLKLKKAMQAGDMTPLQKGKTSARLLAIRKELGAAAAMRPEAAFLAEVGAGKHDAVGIAALLDKIGEAISALQVDGGMTPEAESAADKAFIRWADLELKTNG
jgi:hypothetical protein